MRLRFPPSPTGVLHIGNARTALFNFLYAQQENSVLVLRMEDTDKERSSKIYEQDIINNLKWLGINWQEGPDIGGPYGPYRQSEREQIYEKYIKQLIAENKAYYCFCSAEELKAEREYKMSIGQPPQYSQKCCNLSPEQVEKNLQNKKKYVIRFKTPDKKINFYDLIRKDIEFDTKLIDDFVIAKDLKSPLYNLAVTVDDFEMKISHVIRGEDLLSNTPKQILIQEALGFPSIKFGHLPVILGPDKTKMSKRHGATSIQQYKELGYLKETLINFLAFLGWNPGSEQEIYSLKKLIKDFSLEQVHKAPAIFNNQRLDYLNGYYIRKKDIQELTQMCIPYLEPIQPIITSDNAHQIWGQQLKQEFLIKETKETISFSYLTKIISIYQERLKKISEINELTSFFFKKKLTYNKELLKWKGSDPKLALDKLEKELYKINDWSFINLEKKISELAVNYAQSIGEDKNRGFVMWPLRVALTGQKSSAGPIEIAEILGKEKTLERIKEAKK